MSDTNISSLFNRSGNLTREAMERYISGRLTAEEKAIVIQYLSGSPFEREALEGMKSQVSRKIHKDLEELDAMILAAAGEKSRMARPRRIKPYYWAAAAGLAGLIGLTFLFVWQFRERPGESSVVSPELAVVSPPTSTIDNRQSAIDNNQSTIDNSSKEIGGVAMVMDKPEKVAAQAGQTEKKSLPEPENQVQVVADEPVANVEADIQPDAIVVHDQSTVTAQEVMEEMPATVLQEEVERVNGVQASGQKRTGTSRQTALDHYEQMAADGGYPLEDTVEESKNIFLTVESMPEFPGGDEAFYKFLTDSLHYPQAALEQKIHGRVFVTFVVEKDGSISDARILRGIGGGCDEEALRVINAMPKWIPGKQRGKPVRVQYNLPIMFKLEGK